MDIRPIKYFKNDERGVILECGKSHFVARVEGSASADHTHQEAESLYLVKGKAEITIGGETETVEAPVWFVTKPNEYHKIVALSDIEMIYDRYK